MVRKAALAVAALLGLAACASGYSQFYTPNPTLASNPIGLELGNGAAPEVISSTGDPQADIIALYARGLGVIGVASFNGPNEGMAGAIAQAKKVGATHLVVSSQYARTISGVLPLTTPTTTTSVTSGTANVYGTAGSAYGNYSGTTTTYGSQTTYIPYSVDRYDQRALFVAPIQRKGYGILQRELMPDEIARLGSNKGVMVQSVRRGSPAFNADILPGDIMVSVNGRPVYDNISWLGAMPWGQALKVRVWRNGEFREIALRINPDGSWN